MQKGIIKEVKEIASEGKKTFYEVILQDDSKMTTFDAKIKQADSGDTLEFEVNIAGKYINLRDGWKLTKQTSSSGEEKPLGNGYQMLKEDWVEKQRIERDSIETQVAVKTVLELYGKIAQAPENITGYKFLGDIATKALRWCEAKIDTKQPVPKMATKTKEAPSPIEGEVEFDSSPIENFGALWTRCKNYNISKAEGLELLELTDQSQIVGLNEAWKTIFNRKFKREREAE